MNKVILVFTILLILSVSAFGSEKSQFTELMSLNEFRSLAEELAPKVNLFEVIWKSDSEAEFFGGTTRDYLYWLRGEFKNLKSRNEVAGKVKLLRNKKIIDVREFIIGDSDVDIVSQGPVQSHLASIFQVKKIDRIDSNRVAPGSEAEESERNQGYIPIEKIRLSKSGFLLWKGFGDGIKEIYEGKPTVHFTAAEDFEKTKYALKGLNHPILLVIRYARSLAMNYFYLYGKDFPEEKILYDIEPQLLLNIKKIVLGALTDSSLKSMLKNKQFMFWSQSSIHKSFRSYTNPTAAFLLFKFFGLDKLVARFSDILGPINQYVFAQAPLSKDIIVDRLKKYGMKYEDVFIDVSAEFSDLDFYHGTRTDESFRSIISQGILPSTYGGAGAGLYGVNKKNIEYSIDFGGSKERLIRFKVSSEARIVDITKGKGRALYSQFKRIGDIEEFTGYFGIQIISYPYDVRAYVVKDSAVLSKPQGVYREIISVSQILEKFENKKITDADLKSFPIPSKVTALELDLLYETFLLPWFSSKAAKIESFEEFRELNSLPAFYQLSAIDRSKILRKINYDKIVLSVSKEQDLDKLLEICKQSRKIGQEGESIEREITKSYVLPIALNLAGKVSDWDSLSLLVDKLIKIYLLDSEIHHIFSRIDLGWIKREQDASKKYEYVSKLIYLYWTSESNRGRLSDFHDQLKIYFITPLLIDLAERAVSLTDLYRLSLLIMELPNSKEDIEFIFSKVKLEILRTYERQFSKLKRVLAKFSVKEFYEIKNINRLVVNIFFQALIEMDGNDKKYFFDKQYFVKSQSTQLSQALKASRFLSEGWFILSLYDSIRRLGAFDDRFKSSVVKVLIRTSKWKDNEAFRLALNNSTCVPLAGIGLTLCVIAASSQVAGGVMSFSEAINFYSTIGGGILGSAGLLASLYNNKIRHSHSLDLNYITVKFARTNNLTKLCTKQMIKLADRFPKLIVNGKKI